MGWLRDRQTRALHERFGRAPTLQRVEAATDGDLSRRLVGLKPRADLGACLLLLVAVVMIFVAQVPLYIDADGAQMLIAVPLALVGVAFEIAAFQMIARNQREWRLALQVLDLIEKVEHHPERWDDTRFRGEVNGLLEMYARAVEQMPRQLRPGDPRTREALRSRARCIATGVRELKVWVSFPGDLTFADLLDRLVHDLQTITRGRWFELDRAETAPPPIPLLERPVVLAIGTVVLVGLAVGSAVAGQDVQRAIAIVGPILLAVLTSLGSPALSRLGERLRPAS